MFRTLLCAGVAFVFGVNSPSPSAIAQEFKFDNGTSFETAPAGEFTELKTDLGIWSEVAGKVLVNDAHAKTGKHCLQIAGGKRSSVTLKIAEGIKANGKLSFWAERWTVREPFTFRIEKFAGNVWKEIFNGDAQIQVGRSFLSHIKVSLSDEKITQLRFTVTSPADTGILIDDIKISPAEPMKVASTEIVPLALPALVGVEKSAIIKLKICTTGNLNPISINRIKASIIDESTTGSIQRLQPFYGGSESDFRWDVPFGTARTPGKKISHSFTGDQKLSEGDNYVWLACELRGDVDIDKTIAARIDSITFSNGMTTQLAGKPSVQRMGIAVRSGGEDGVHTYRIPGLATTNEGTLIGVYDARYDGGGDLPGNIDVGMSRSTDGGRTWEPMKIIMDMGRDRKWRGDGIGDPAILVDRKTGTIWVAATWSHGDRSWRGSGPGLEPEETGQWIMVKSEDDGKSWSDPINITKQVKKSEWSFLLQGPGKGITLSDGTIVFPAQYQDPPNDNDKQAHRLPHSTFIFSRDHGETWKTATGAWDDTTESQIVELKDGELMLNCRNNRAPQRAIMTTSDMGITWQPHSTHVRGLIEPGSCMASLINVGRELNWRKIRSDFNNEFLLFSNPDSLRGRNHMTIKASKDSGTTWPTKSQLLLDEQGGAGYSCMTMIDAETVGILYEGSQAHMTFQRIKIKDILSPPKDQKTINPARAEIDSNHDPSFRQTKSAAGLSFARPFGDHMVLQAEQPVRIWGFGKPGSTVRVRFPKSGVYTSAVVNQRGAWLAEMPSQPVNPIGQPLTLFSNGKTIEIKDVLFGDVWICAGQSNMEWPLSKSTKGKLAIAKAGDNLIRLHNCVGGARGSSGVYSEQKFARLWPDRFSKGEWQIDSSKSSSNFSAVGYYFATSLRAKLNRPIGMINVSVGGTPIESWVSKERLIADSTLAKIYDDNWLENPVLDAWCKKRARHNLKRGLAGDLKMPADEYGPNHSFKPGFMYEAGIKPFSPLSIRGGLWYQGESNAENPQRSKLYDACFPLLVADWRASFQNDDLPIAFVQLPAMGRANWPVFREYQRRSLEKIRNVGMAITIDTGNPTNVHPPEKKSVGYRLAHWALVEVYGQDEIPMGPILSAKVVRGDVIEISFVHAGEKLVTTDGQPPNHFEVAGEDGIYLPAHAKIVDDKIELTNRQIRRPVHARYAWSAFPKPKPNLVNSAGLPASPFTTEDVFHD